MSCRTKAIFTMIFLAPVLTEIVSGNTPPHALLNLATTGFLLLAYSFPLLVIRELSWRWRLPVPGVFLLGLAYGIVNEGLLAQTLLRSEHVPISNFDHYIYAAGINFSWACLIVPWHALLAVVFPLALIVCWFPSCAKEAWLGNRVFVSLAAILIAALVFVTSVRPPRPQMLAFLVAIAVLVVCASFFRNRLRQDGRQNDRRVRAFRFGSAFYSVFFFGLILLAAAHVPPIVFFILVVALLVCSGWIGARLEVHLQPAAAHVALGSYFAASGFHFLAGVVHRSAESIVTASLLAVGFIVLARRTSCAGETGLT
jgi:MFS family permease